MVPWEEDSDWIQFLLSVAIRGKKIRLLSASSTIERELFHCVTFPFRKVHKSFLICCPVMTVELAITLIILFVYLFCLANF